MNVSQDIPAFESLETRLLASAAAHPAVASFALGDGNAADDAADIDTLFANMGSTNPQYLFGGNSVVNQADVLYFVENVLHSLPGDALLTGKVDGADAQVVLNNWGQSGGWAQGDFNGDGLVNYQDLQIVLDNFGKQNPLATSPTIPAVTQPGATITATANQFGTGWQLLVVGTAGADSMTISQTASSITLTTPQGSTSFNGAFTSVVVYDFDGNDTIRTTSTVTASVYISVGDGNDSIFNAATGAGTIILGNGNDLVVSVGAGQTAVTGGAGLDSYWLDSADTLTNVSAASTAAGAVHMISQFYQPFSNNPSDPNYVPMTVAGQSLTEPAVDGYASGYASFAGSPLFVGAPQFSDIKQGDLGDCYFMASLASMAQDQPQAILQAIAPLGDGTYVVRFYSNGRPVYLRIDAELPVNFSGSLPYARAGDQGQIWAPLLEKAYAFFRTGANSYDSLSGGWMGDVYRNVENAGDTSVSISTSTSSSSLVATFQSALAAGDAVTVASTGATVGPIYPNHAYMVQAVTATTVTVYNPWGYDGATWDSTPDDGLLTLPLKLFEQAFCCAAISD